MKKCENRKFCQGYCGEFAAALHNVFGYEVGMFVGLDKMDEFDREQYELDKEEYGEDFLPSYYFIHAFAYHPSGNIVDVKGVRSKKEALKNNVLPAVNEPGDEVREVPTTVEELDAQSGEGLDHEMVEEAEEWILSHRREYA